MDPNATLEMIRQAAVGILSAADADTGVDDRVVAELAEEMAQAFSDLDTWLDKGGFLPRSWNRQPAATN